MDKQYHARDWNTGDYYGGKVDPALVKEMNDKGADTILATQRSVVVDNYGRTENVWIGAPEPDLPGPIPGEYRWLYFEEYTEVDA